MVKWAAWSGLFFSLCGPFLFLPIGEAAAVSSPKAKPARDLSSFLADNRQRHSWLGYFELAGITAMQMNGGYVAAPYVAWKPTLVITEWMALRGSLGITYFKNQNPSNRLFRVTDYTALFAFGLDDGILEIGGGAQSWDQNGGTKPLVAGNIAIPRTDEWFGFIDRVVLGYSIFFSSPRLTHEFRLGAGVAF